MKFINLTPHTITLNDGTSFPTEGNARVTDTYTEFNTSGVCKVKHGEIEGLPESEAHNTPSSYRPWYWQQQRKKAEKMW